MTRPVKAAVSTEQRTRRLSLASVRNLIEPDLAVVGEFGPGQLLPDEQLSIHGLDVDLTPEQRVTLSREEVAAIMQTGIRLEAVLMTGFCLQLALTDDATDPRMVYALHEVGEETRHSRLFARAIEQLAPTARNPLRGHRWLRRVEERIQFALCRRRALLNTLILGGEEIPDLVQKLASEHPDTDPYLAAISRYHRQEEARHLSFARMLMAERWAEAGWTDRFAVRYIAPKIVGGLFQMMVHPGVYRTVGLPPMETWRAVRELPARIDMRHRATRPVLRALLDADVFRPGRIPRGWRDLCGVDVNGEPLPAGVVPTAARPAGVVPT